MNKTLILLLLFTCFLACSKKNKHSFGEFSPKNIERQVFKITLNKDTLLKTKSGVLIKLSANTFVNTTLAEVEIIVREIINKEQLLKSGMPTLDDKGNLLETGGMINILTNPRIDINSKFPIQVSIPVIGVNPNMKKYTADIDNGDLLWKYVEPLANNQKFNDLIEGEQLFIKNCSDCHAKSLDAQLTGPELGCIEIGENSRKRDWLIKFTKNSQKMIAEGDNLAMCNWNSYKPSVMSNFEFLTDLQINQIYDYINNESLRRNICDKGEVYGRNSFDVPNCNFKSDTSSHSANDYYNYDNNVQINLEPENIIEDKFEINYEKTTNGKVFTRTYYYTFTVSDYNWINCDRPFNEPEVDAFNVIAETDLEMFLIFKNRKSLWPFCTWKGQYILIETEDEAKVNLPIGEQVTIFAFSKPQNGKRKISELQTELNNYRLKAVDLVSPKGD
jgi:mono/diheme cytochrome c family protein